MSRIASNRTRAGGRATRGFSLLETMIAVAIVGLIGMGVANLLTENTRQYTDTRARLVISAAAQQTFERVIALAGTSSLYGGSDAFCETVVAGGGPLAGGSVVAGHTSCPDDYWVTTIPIDGSTLTQEVRLTSVSLGAADGLDIVVLVNNPRTNRDLEIRTQVAAP